VLREEEGVEGVEVAEVDKDGIRLVAGTWAETPTERGAVAAAVRARCLEALRAERICSRAAVS
ncbi:MAG: hypothetical protein M3133_04530, partial [Actinomycetota bacterium]|nr:hypothetical protein [Actinomycetota bacterium]